MEKKIIESRRHVGHAILIIWAAVIFFGLPAYGQVSSEFQATPSTKISPLPAQGFRIVDISSIKKRDHPRYFLIYDGIPIYNRKEMRIIFETVDTTMIDSLYFKKGPLTKCDEKAYKFVLILSTKDSINMGLKFILARTNNWIIENPTADIKINNTKKKFNKSRFETLAKTDVSLFDEIEVIAPAIDDGECDNGTVSLTIRH